MCTILINCLLHNFFDYKCALCIIVTFIGLKSRMMSEKSVWRSSQQRSIHVAIAQQPTRVLALSGRTWWKNTTTKKSCLNVTYATMCLMKWNILQGIRNLMINKVLNSIFCVVLSWTYFSIFLVELGEKKMLYKLDLYFYISSGNRGKY